MAAPPKRTSAGTWQVRYRDPSGRQRSKTFRTRKLADKWQAQALADIERGEFRDPKLGRMTVEEWSQSWLASAHNLRPKSLRAYRHSLSHILPVLGGLRLGRVTSEDIDAYLTARLATGTAPSSVHREYRAMVRLFNVAVQRGHLLRSPMVAISAPRVPPSEMRFLDAAELERLAATIDRLVEPRPGEAGDRRKGRRSQGPAYSSLILVAGWGGLRWGELAALRSDRVDAEAGRVHVVEQADLTGKILSAPKTRAGSRWVTLPAGVMPAVLGRVEASAGGGLLWGSARGGPLVHSNWVSRYFKPAVVAAGLDPAFRAHDLRHTACALAIKAGCHPKALQARMGHSSIQVTLDRYGHLYPEMDAELALALDEIRADAIKPRLRAV